MRMIFIPTLVLLYIILFIAERQWPLRNRTRSVLPRIMLNLTFTALVFLTATLCVQPVVMFSLHFTTQQTFGLLHFIPGNAVSHFILGFLLMDLTFYYWHRLNHEIPLLWRFHNAHHIDPDLDVTTSFRFHFVEIAYSSIFRLFQLFIIGINPLAFFCYEFTFQANTFFQHSNLKLPLRFERIINIILVTPRMHGIHHSNYRNETNRNYGVVLSFWDRLHRTIKLNIPQQKITIGVPAYSQTPDNTLTKILLMPFKKQRHYWQIKSENHLKRTLPPGPLQE
jgi:sterol desaturase/sphingolipid hydroxylase (fatty acid hydroxylase superfamily)